MTRYFATTLMITLLSANAGNAQDRIYTRCLDAIEADDVDEVRSLAEEIKKMDRHADVWIEHAEKCVSAATGEPMRLLRMTGEYFPEDMYDQARDAEVQRRQAAEEREREILLRNKRRKRLNQELIASDILYSCTSLYSQNTVAAMTNQVCIDTFSAHGHPKLSETVSAMEADPATKR